MEDTRTDAQRKESQRLHQLSQKYYDQGQNALCFLVIGGIILVIGILFIFLAQQRKNNIMVGLNVGSLAFYIMVIGIALGSLLCVFGLIKFLVAFFKRKKVISQINALK